MVEESSTTGPLVELCHRRWAIPILALCAGAPGAGAKFVTFATTLGLSRETLTQTLADLIEQDLIARATGARHPLRPEYVLTKTGLVIAPACRAILKELRRLDVEDIGLRKWSLPLLVAISAQPRRTARFNVIQAALPDATPRAIAAGLRDLAEAEFISRDILNTYPPSADYRVARPGVRLAAATLRLTLELLHRTTPTSRPREVGGDGFRLRKTA